MAVSNGLEVGSPAGLCPRSENRIEYDCYWRIEQHFTFTARLRVPLPSTSEIFRLSDIPLIAGPTLTSEFDSWNRIYTSSFRFMGARDDLLGI